MALNKGEGRDVIEGMGGTLSLVIMQFTSQGWQDSKETGVMGLSQTAQFQIQVLPLQAV